MVQQVVKAATGLVTMVRKNLTAVLGGVVASVLVVWLLSPGVLLNLPPMEGGNPAPAGIQHAEPDLRMVPLESNLASALVHAVVIVVVLGATGGLVVAGNSK